MSIIAATAKVAAIALACVGAGRPVPDEAPRTTTRDTRPPRLQCRMYFGCTSAASSNTTVAQQQEFVR